MHTHEAQAGHTSRLDSGRVTEHCTCGATRITLPDGRIQAGYVGGKYNAKMSGGGWHTCDLCAHNFGKETA